MDLMRLLNRTTTRSKLRGTILLVIAAWMLIVAIVHQESLPKSSRRRIPESRPELYPETKEATDPKGPTLKRRNLFDLNLCEDRLCAKGENGTLNCRIDEAFEEVCCEESNEGLEFEELANCEDHSGRICRAENICVAELIPGISVAAECLSVFELNGGIVVYILLLLYLFLALAIVCDDYFSFALDMCGEVLGLSSDVKGATFAAIGSSAPELFVSLADNVVSNPPKSVGIGTVVGSAIFNILVIIGASAVVAGNKFGSLDLDWKPLLRDSIFYVVSIAALLGVVLTDESARHYEGFLLVCFYAVYLVFMVFNEKIFAFVDNKLGIKENPVPETEDETEPDLKRQTSFGTALSKGVFEEELPFTEPYFAVFHWPQLEEQSENEEEKLKKFLKKNFSGGKSVWLKRLYFLLVFPINVCFRFTIPDARYDLLSEDKNGETHKRRILYSIEFFMCIIWIAILSHLLVFFGAKFGCILGIEPAVMGLTILAAGTSVPDMITSIILTMNGEVDAAVANSIGSNVFDILIGLGLPWLLAEFVYGKPSVIQVEDLSIAIAFLFGVLIALILALGVSRFKLNLKLGITLLILYALYVVFELFVRSTVL